MSVTLSGEARTRLDTHLDAVEAALVGKGVSREERRAVVDDLEAQILDMLAAKSESPGVADVEAVLTQLDPPAAYGTGTPGTSAVPAQVVARVAPSSPRYSKTAIWGLVCILLSFLPVLVILPASLLIARREAAERSAVIENFAERQRMQQAEEWRRQHEAGATSATSGPAEALPGGVPLAGGSASTTAATAPSHQLNWSPPTRTVLGAPCLICAVGPLGLLGTVLGWVALGQIRASKGALRGMGLALFDGLFYPVITVLIVLVMILFMP